MKKQMLTILVIILCAMVGLGGCSAGVSQNDYDKAISDLAILQNKYDDLEQDYDELLSMYAEYKVDDFTSGVSQQQSGATTQDEPVASETETHEVYSDDYVTIWYSHCEQSYGDECNVVFVAENKTDVELLFGVNSLAVDGWNLADAFAYQAVSANSKGFAAVS